MYKCIENALVSLVKKSVIKNLSMLEENYSSMNSTLERILILTNLDPRPQKTALQKRAQHILFVFHVELAGIQSFAAMMAAGTIDLNRMLKILVLSTSQIRKNKKEAFLLEDLLKSYDGYTDHALANLSMLDSWVN